MCYKSIFRLLAALSICLPTFAFAQVSGKVMGTVKDPAGAVIPNVSVRATERDTGVTQETLTDAQGNFVFPILRVGTYDLQVHLDGFKDFTKAGLVVNGGTATQLEIALEVAAQQDMISVVENAAHVETTDTQLGEVIDTKQIVEAPLNGRSYTDLFAIQGGVTPLTTSGAQNSSSGGGFGTVPAGGNSNTGQFSIHGQRESANGFYLNGASVQESIGQQAGMIPNLDSIAEFRILTSNSDAEYGNYSGGLINVVTKSGGNQFHGSAFEFLRNTDLDSRGFFSPERSAFQQNQYGATIGGPVRANQIFFFGDYQGQRTIQGMETGITAVPSMANRAGDFSDSASTFTGTVNGDYLAQTLSSRLGYPVLNGESFYASGCMTTTQCVFPNTIIPKSAFALPATRMLQYIPLPNLATSQFSSGAEKRRLHDEKGAMRIDINTTKHGSISSYYLADRYNLDDPYPAGFGGATLPGPNGPFDALSSGLDQLAVVSHTMSFGTKAVNEMRFSFTRLNNNLGFPKGGVGVTLADQGISTGPEGIKQGFPAQAGVELMYFNSFAVGTNPFSLEQVNNTYQISENFSKVVASHTLKLGGQYSFFRVKQLPNLVANGTFSFFGSGNQSTGNGFADFLLGFPDFYSQQSSPAFYENATTGGIFVQDSWHARPTLTINYGVRWDYITPWSEQHRQITTLVPIPGLHSATFPGAPAGYLVPGDPLPDGSRIPDSVAPTPHDNFSPRIGVAYAPNWTGSFLNKLTGGAGKTSIRIGGGRFFSSVEGLTVAYPTGNPPYGLTYTSPEPPQMDQPFIGVLTGTRYIQQFPVNVPPYNVSPSNPFYTDWSRYVPIGGAGSVWYKNKTPYTMTFHLTLDRQIGSDVVASASYIASLGRHLLTVVGANPGNPSRCLSLSHPQDVAPGTPTCGPFGENVVYTRSDGVVINGTRAPFDNDISSDAWYANMGNSNYNGLELTLKRTSGRVTWLASYTYSKSLDQSSSIQEQVYPFDFHKEYGISAFDIKHNFVTSYTWDLPFDQFFTSRPWTSGWAISGIARFANGLPVTFASFGDNALVNVQNNGVNSISIDLPDYLPGNLNINHNPRNGLEYFNTSLFTANALGTPGTSSRRFFYGPGIDNFDTVIRKTTKLSEGRTLELRLEGFNTFNHAQFFGAGAVDGNINSPTFGHVLHAAPPRIVQLGAKLVF